MLPNTYPFDIVIVVVKMDEDDAALLSDVLGEKSLRVDLRFCQYDTRALCEKV